MDHLAGHPLGFARDIVEYQVRDPAHLPGVAAAVLHILYAVPTDEALVEALQHHALFQAFVGPGVARWGVADYRSAREGVRRGGWDSPLGLAIAQLQAAEILDRSPFKANAALIADWIQDGGPRFEDLATMKDVHVQRVIKQVDTKHLAFALHGAPPEVRARIDANVSTRMRGILADELLYIGPGLRPQDVGEVRAGIAALMRRLKALGELG